MARLATLRKGDWDQLDRLLNSTDLTAEEVRKLNKHPEVLALMLAAMRQHDVFRLVHGLWTPFNDVVQMASDYEGVSGTDIYQMLCTANESGLIEGFKAESPKNPLLAPVIVKNQGTVPTTLLFARALMQKRWGEKYDEWAGVYASGVDDNRVKLIEGARPFVPGELSLRIVDFGANWDREHGNVLRDVQRAQAGDLAGFEVIFAASQHPGWVQQMDGVSVPYAIAAALILNVPEDYVEWTNSPLVWRRDGSYTWLNGCARGSWFKEHAMPRLMEYKR